MISGKSQRKSGQRHRRRRVILSGLAVIVAVPSPLVLSELVLGLCVRAPAADPDAPSYDTINRNAQTSAKEILL
jgi:hypothetical protein